MHSKTLGRYFLLAVLLLTVSEGWSYIPGDSLLLAKKDSVFTIQTSTETESFYLESPADVLEEGLLLPATNGDSIQRYIDLARSVMDKVRSAQNFITHLDEASKVELPVGISRTISGISYDIAIHAIRLKPAYAEIDVFMEFKASQNDQTLTFMGRNIKFTKKGGIVGDAKLELIGDYAINFSGDKIQIILKGGGAGEGTYAVMDCDGFRELALDASVKFSRDLIVPESSDGTRVQGNVVTRFRTVMTDWNDLVVQVDLPAFQVQGLNGVGFAVQDAVLDFSDLRNAPAVVFPKDYQSNQLLPENLNLWRGFYLRELSVSLPPEFEKKGNSGRTPFAAENVLMDNRGITGDFSGANLITLTEGDMNGWAFSVDSLKISLQANQLVNAGFSGGIVIPVGKEEKPFEYAALINTGGNYLFHVSPATEMEFPLWGASEVEIYEASYLDVALRNGKFLPKANLHGRMAVHAKLSEGGQGIELADISFENLAIQSVKPFIQVGNFSFGSEALQQKMAGFPISIQDIGLKNITDTQVGLDFTLKLNLVGENSGGFAADAGLTMVANMDATGGTQRWRYKEINVRDIGVDIDGGAFKINGQLAFYRNDVTYGDGFNGNVKAEFTPGLKVTATAIFGNVSEMRYWYADAMVNFPSGIPVFTGVAIYGFGGGAYQGMKMDNQGGGSALGKTASGIVYVPDTKAGLGLKAIVSLGSHPKPEAFNADVTFEISFFKGGGVRHIAFGGNGYLVTPGLDINLDKLKTATGKMAAVVKKAETTISDKSMGLLKSGGSENSMTEIFGEVGDKAGEKGQISAKVMIDYDFENRVLHGNFEVFINVAGGIIKGVGAGGRAGWAVLHFAPKEWYVYVGTPDDRIGISVGIGSIRANATSYFMVGTKILGSPPPPPEVSRILRMNPADLDYMGDLNAIGTGGGFAFGAALSVSTGDLSFLMFYARLDAGAGFDIMLKDYGDLRCKGSSSPIGINGWYANGQAYAYFEGAIGIRVKVFGRRKSVKILELGAAAILQAKLPNPFWMRGIVGGYFSVLGGLVKGNCKFQVTLGKDCEIVTDPNAVLDDIQVIAEITPSNGETEVNVFNTPQVVFNMPVNKNFVLIDDAGVKRTFRIKLDHLNIMADRVKLPGSNEWNDNGDVLVFNSYEILPPKKQIVVSAQVSFEEQKNGNWVAVTDGGQRVTEKMEQAFTTGVAPDYIPPENIEYSYPIAGQANFYRDETNEGYIKLKVGQAYLFSPGAEWKQQGRFSGSGQQQTWFDFKYNTSAKTVSFSIPGGLQIGTAYTVELLNVPAQQAGAIDRNVTELSSKVQTGGQTLDTEIRTKQAEGAIETLEEKAIFATHIRTSRFSTLSAKMDALTYSKTFYWETDNGVVKMYYIITGDEMFDKFETDPVLFDATVQFEALLNNAWYQEKMKPLLYENYPLAGQVGVYRRDGNVLGIPPVRAIYFLKSSDAQVDPKAPESPVDFGSSANLQSFFAVEVGNDYLDMRARAAYLSLTVDSPELNRLLASRFPFPSPGDYQFKVKYVLPGTKKVTSEKIMTYRYGNSYE